MSDQKTPDVLIPALRQYQHNDCSGLLAGYDYFETNKIVLSLQKRIAELESKYLNFASDARKRITELEQHLKFARENPTEDTMSTWQAVAGKYRTENEKLKQQLADLQAKIDGGVRVVTTSNNTGTLLALWPDCYGDANATLIMDVSINAEP